MNIQRVKSYINYSIAKTGTRRPDVVTFLQGKNKALSNFRAQELHFKEKALAAETKLKQESLDIEKIDAN